MKTLQAFNLSESVISLIYKEEIEGIIEDKVKEIPFEDLTPEQQKQLTDASVVVTDRLAETETFKNVLAQITPDQSLSEERLLVYCNEHNTPVIVNVSSMRRRPAGSSEYDLYLDTKSLCESLI